METILEFYNNPLVQEFLFGTREHQRAIAPFILAAAPGAIKAIGSLFGSGKRKEAERDAERELAKRRAAVENFQFDEASNPYANVTNAFADVTNTAADLQNTYADLRVSTQGAEFKAEQNAQNQANILDALVQGGGNAAANATALAAQSTDANAQIAADIDRQVVANETLKAQGEAARQQAFAAGEARRQELFGQGLQTQQQLMGAGEQFRQKLNYEQEQQYLNRDLMFMNQAQQQLGAAQAARARARENLIGGLGSAVGGALGALGQPAGASQIAKGDAIGANNRGLSYSQAIKNNRIAAEANAATNFEDLGDGIGYYSDLDDI